MIEIIDDQLAFITDTQKGKLKELKEKLNCSYTKEQIDIIKSIGVEERRLYCINVLLEELKIKLKLLATIFSDDAIVNDILAFINCIKERYENQNKPASE